MVGTWLDTGSADDYAASVFTTNRGKLTILDAKTTTWPDPPYVREFEHTEVLGDDLAAVGAGNGLSSGVFGVKIDDVDGDGTPEIWAGDAFGHLFLFAWKASTSEWVTVYRSETLVPYVGWWNGIYPIKANLDGSGATVRMLVRSTGYWMGFDVDSSQLVFP